MKFDAFLTAAQSYRDAARSALIDRLARSHIDQDQRAAHGFAWLATSVAALQAMASWAEYPRSSLLDQNIAALGFAETIAQIVGGLPMGQNELFRPADLGLTVAASQLAATCSALLEVDYAGLRASVARALAQGETPTESLDDVELDEIRGQFRRFSEAEILPFAHAWHLKNALISDETVRKMADLGTFGVCIPEEFGGLGLSKLVMCIVTEELSRDWIGAGSLGTRSEIAGELIAAAGTSAQKAHWLPKIAAGETLPTAVFTEPDTGSDLGSLKAKGTRTALRRVWWRFDSIKPLSVAQWPRMDQGRGAGR